MGKKVQDKTKIIRPSWDEVFMLNALLVSTRGSCYNLQTGCIIVRDKRIISSGYNGAPPGIRNCLEVGCRKEREGVDWKEKGKAVCRGTHAEMNALNQISRWDLENTIMYTLYYPCSTCAKHIAGTGIREVVYGKVYDELETLTQELFGEKGIALRQFGLDIEKYFNVMRRIWDSEKK